MARGVFQGYSGYSTAFPCWVPTDGAAWRVKEQSYHTIMLVWCLLGATASELFPPQ